MKSAIIYVRVSTDEQASQGYSQRSQEEMLLNYCSTHGIFVDKIVYEDFSAKTFFRPEWSKVLDYLGNRTIKGNVSLILFTKWDRFSRNAGDAYMMINRLRKLGVEAQAIEQPLDLSVPENKMMLAFYLAAPEVENDRRALNVIYGMRRALKEGRWLWRAPYGYRNARDPDGKPTVIVQEEEARHLKWIFETIALGVYSSEQILLQARRNGAKIKRNRFWGQIRNPFYKGEINIPAFRDEKEIKVKGNHTAIISPELFDAVQKILEGRKRKRRTQVVGQNEIPLRGFLNCPKCNRVLTASASKGRNKYYSYYHCTSACGVRFNASDVNEKFVDKLKSFIPKPGLKEVCEVIFRDVNGREIRSNHLEKKKVLKKIDEAQKRVAKARDLLLQEELDIEEYKQVKRSSHERLLELESQIEKIEVKPVNSSGKHFEFTARLDLIFSFCDLSQKRRLIGAVFPENLTFDGEAHQTDQIDEAVGCVYFINKG